MLAFNDATQTITMTDKTGLNVIRMALGRINVTGKAVVTLEAPLIKHGEAAGYPSIPRRVVGSAQGEFAMRHPAAP